MDGDTLTQTLADIRQNLGAVMAQVADVKEDTRYLRSRVDDITRTQADHQIRIERIEVSRAEARESHRFRIQTLAAWFGATFGSADFLWNALRTLGGHR